jgi:hypothetical protein
MKQILIWTGRWLGSWQTFVVMIMNMQLHNNDKQGPALNSPTDIQHVVSTNLFTFNEFGVIQFSSRLMSHPLSLLWLSL